MSRKMKSSVRFGPGASSLILIFVVLAMSVLGMLSLMNSRNDVRLSERSVQVAEAVYALEARAEEKLATLDGLLSRGGKEALAAALPEGVSLEADVLAWTDTDGFRRLDCAVRILPEGSAQRLQWVRCSLTAVTEGD